MRGWKHFYTCRNNACLSWLHGENALLEGSIFPCEGTRFVLETKKNFHPPHRSKLLPSTKGKMDGEDESKGYCRGMTEKDMLTKAAKN